MTSNYSLTIKAKKELLERYFGDEYDFSKVEPSNEEEIEIYICAQGYILDIAERMTKENPLEHIFLETHAVDLYAYSGDHYYEQINGEIKEWTDTSKIDDVF